MTTKEFKRRAEKLGYVVREDENEFVLITGYDRIHIEKDVVLDDGSDFLKRCQLNSLMLDYASTPLDKRKPEPLYRVRLMGFNSDNGHQYLTTKERGNAFGKMFACAYNPRLKQAFTAKELDALAERPDFKEEGWVQTLLYVGREKITDNMTW